MSANMTVDGIETAHRSATLYADESSPSFRLCHNDR